MKKDTDIKISRDEKENKKLELIFCLVVGIIFLILLVLSFRYYVFVSATMIIGGLELFGLGYYYRRDDNKINLVYILFILGVCLLIASIIYLIVRTV